MNFFQSQEAARRKTTQLVVYYALAVFFIIVGVYLAIALTFIGVASQQERVKVEVPPLWNVDLMIGVALGTLLVVLFGSLYKIKQLSGGGSVVAESLGGRELVTGSRDRHERKLLNIVEEMSIASGVPMPRVYVMDGEEGINAFAAGYSLDDAVVAVTRGCMEQLNRDELQGVIAHEFSHILNGDMKINIRLMGVLNGILIIGILGYFVMRMTLFSGSRSRSDKKGGALPIAVMGIIIMAVGYIGVFFGKLIKAAVSRQREFLADASAVQFTRNPDGISNALKKIGGYASGSHVQHTNASQASHFFFANGMRRSFVGLFATHPPLPERIRRIDPHFDNEMHAAQQETAAELAGSGASNDAISGFAGAATEARIEVSAEQAVERVGAPTPDHVAYAGQVIAALPDSLVDAAREGYGARAVIYALLLDTDADVRQAQIERLGQHADEAVLQELERVAEAVSGLSAAYRLPLIDIAIPALRAMSLGQFEQFAGNVEMLVSADMEIDLFEYTLQRIIIRHLEPTFKPGPPPAIAHKHLFSALPSCRALLSCLAGWGADSLEAAHHAFELGWQEFLIKDKADLIPPEHCGVGLLDEALNDLEHAAPAIKQRIVAAATSCIGADGDVTLEEAELIRTICDALHCPMPPFIQNANAAA